MFKSKVTYHLKIKFFIYLILSFIIITSNFIAPKISFFISSNVFLYTKDAILIGGTPLKLIINFVKNKIDKLESYDNILTIINENKRLKNQIIQNEYLLNQLTQYQNLLHNLDTNNHVLSAAKVITLMRNKYEYFFCKTDKDVQKNMLVIDQYGLVGKVINFEQSNKVAKVQLLSDVLFKIPAMTTNNNIYGFFVGNLNTNNKCIGKFIMLNNSIKLIKEGDILITSGEFNITKKGIIIGTIASINDNEICIESVAKINNLNFVFIID